MLSSFNKIHFVLAAAAAVQAATFTGSGKSTRYWDCCKPSCAWPDKAAVDAPFKTCDAKGNKLTDALAVSGCSGGESYTCADNQPWAVSDKLAYGFAATKFVGQAETDWCCGCYLLTFKSGAAAGKQMVVQSSNTGGDLGENHFDILIPGGGLGIFDGCTSQFGQPMPGDRYGGVSSADQCGTIPASLKDGCDWRFSWFANADNPSLDFERVQCPAEIIAKSGCKRADDGDYPAAPGSGGAVPSSSAQSGPGPSTKPADTTPTTKASAPATTQDGSAPTSTKGSGNGDSCKARKRAVKRRHAHPHAQ